MAKLSWEDRITIKSLTERQCSNRQIARLLGVSEGTVRYHRRRQAADAVDGRLGGVPATVRVDNEKTAVVARAGAWETVHPVYERYAQTGLPGHRYRIPSCGAAVVSNSPWRGAEGSPRHRMSSCLHGLESGIHA